MFDVSQIVHINYPTIVVEAKFDDRKMFDHLTMGLSDAFDEQLGENFDIRGSQQHQRVTIYLKSSSVNLTEIYTTINKVVHDVTIRAMGSYRYRGNSSLATISIGQNAI